MASWKPDGYNTVSPYLVVAGAQAVIDFLEAAFDATELRRYRRSPSNSIPEGRSR